MRTPAGGISAADPRPSQPPGAARPDTDPDAGDAGERAHTEASGSPSPPTRSDSGAKAVASLAGLEEAIQQVSTGLNAALDVNARLASELADVRALLETSQTERDEFERQLEAVLRDAERNREFLINEQDNFLAGMLEEHEEAIAKLEKERDVAVEAAATAAVSAPDSRPPSTGRTVPGLGELRPVDPREAQTARPPKRTNPGLGESSPPPGVTAPIDPNIESLDKLLAERERTREVLKRLQAQRDEAQQALVEVTRERNSLMRDLEKLDPSRFGEKKLPWSPHSSRRTQPAIPQVLARATDPSPADEDAPDAPDDSASDRVTAPPNDDALAAIDASRPSPEHGTPKPSEEPGVGADGRPLLKRKPDPTTRSMGGYSMSGNDVEPSDEPKARRNRR
jgi:hypothetical protein